MESDGKDLEHNGWVGLAAPRRAVAEGVNKPRRLRAFMSLTGAAVFLSFLLPRRFLHANVAKEISSKSSPSSRYLIFDKNDLPHGARGGASARDPAHRFLRRA